MSDRIDELGKQILDEFAIADVAPAVFARVGVLTTELATIARENRTLANQAAWNKAEADKWRKLAIHLATVAAEASVPTHFTTTDAIARATEYHLASAMFCQDDGTLFRHPENALDAAREAVKS